MRESYANIEEMAANLEQIKTTIQALPPVEQESILRWLEEKREQNGVLNALSSPPPSHKSLAWINENRRNYLGKWVALDGGHLVAVGSTAVEVYNAAKEAGVQVPFVELIADEEPDSFTGGWIS